MFLLIAFLVLAGAAEASLCVPCRETREVALVLTSDNPASVSDSIAMPSASFWGMAARFDGLPTRHHWVGSREDVRAALLAVARSCERVKVLKWYSHGAVGTIVPGTEPLTVLEAGSVFGGLDCAMAPMAEIDLNACNTGRGCRGEDFMAELARLLLSKGGSVTAATSWEMSLGPLSPMFPVNGDLQTLRVEPGFEGYRWDNEPRSPGACVERVRDDRRELLELRRRAEACGIAHGLDGLNRAFESVAHDQKRLAPLGRTGFTRAHAKRARRLQGLYLSWFRARDELERELVSRGCR